MDTSCGRALRTASCLRQMPYVIVLVSFLSVMATPADAQNISDLAYSDWETTYRTPNGTPINASVHLRGTVGYYINDRDMRGILSDITYHERFNHESIANIQIPNPSTPAITGTFNLHGATGFFVFRAPNQNGKMDGYSGSWNFIDGDLLPAFGGSWDGTLTRIIPNPNQPVVPKSPIIRVGKDPPLNPTPDRVFGKSETNTLADAVTKARATASIELTPAEKAVVAPMGWIKLHVRQANELEGVKDPAIDDNYFVRLMNSRNFVCKVVALSDMNHPYLGGINQGQVLGTGFLVGKSLLLTSNHVVPTSMSARTVAVAFEGGANEQFAVREIVHSSPVNDRDFSLLRLEPNPGSKTAGEIYGYYNLKTSHNNRAGLYPYSFLVNMIHYPRGQEHRSYEIRGRRLLFKGDENDPKKRPFVAYDASTEEGSSGAPVFNDFWWVVALHKGRQQLDDDPIENIDKYRKGVRIDVIIDSILAQHDAQVLKDLGLD
jgi:hypothetical protein